MLLKDSGRVIRAGGWKSVLSVLGRLLGRLLVRGLVIGAVGMSASVSAAQPLRIALPLQPTASLLIVALEKGFIAAQGVAVEVQEYPSGKAALLDGLLRGRADMAQMADVPAAFAMFLHPDFRLIATVNLSENTNRIVANRASGIGAPIDLLGKRVATQKASAVHYFLHLVMLRHRISKDAITAIYMPGAELPKALAEGEIDAFAMREPYVSEAQQLLGGNALVMEEPGLYPQFEVLAASESALRDSEVAIEGLLRGLRAAQEWVAKHPDETVDIVSRRLGADPQKVSVVLQASIQRIALPQELLAALEDEMAWAVRAGLVEGKLPNVLRWLDSRPINNAVPGVATVME
ncbi:MAG: NrtA/SsuA/CpmA family ABC transporter substrate-binding protein [Gammaproteobacteria bacterium]|nr:NrtA/SsuA/CpmA family ABC transporter substrate-binding protein [Gammaproteobacteria bacterium]MCP5135662.1 NrtA/SsuA/CpmA family ABC transporter substrate-binding protein [Gammaproteobacteria bacterium]